MEHGFQITALGSEHATELFIGQNILESKKFAEKVSKIAERFAVITDAHVGKLYDSRVVNALEKLGLEGSLFSFPAGEANKTRETKQMLEDKMLSAGMGRDGAVLALGGGVVTDMAGFVASTYCRGIPLVSMPTTLMGMVDAAIGGKNGVNTPKGKNLIGTFYQPKAIFIDTHFLETLSEDNLRCGTAEIIKYGLISSPPLLEFLDQLHERWLAVNQDFFQELIYQSCLAKKNVIEEDPLEKGLRRILNFGHTIGHAIEMLENYRICHGDAVAIGIIVECYISLQMGCLKKDVFDSIFALIKKYHFPLRLSDSVTEEKMMEAMALDKKSISAFPRFVILSAIGQVEEWHGQYCEKVNPEIVKDTLHWMLQQFSKPNG